ncbi:MAG: hypothetical protein ACOCV1_07475 [Bacillota bacterium]
MRSKDQFRGNAKLAVGALLLAAAGTLFSEGIKIFKGSEKNE